MTNKVEVTIKWGAYYADGDPDQPITTYEFDTEGELKAFLEGIDEMDGWAGYEIVEDHEDGQIST